MVKKIFSIVLVCLSLKAFSQAVDPPSDAQSISSFSLKPENIGSIQHSVNLFSGDLNVPITLVSVSGKEGLGINVSMSYNSNVQNQVDTWNLDSPTGILGLGWSMDVPKIICDHKNTGTREDDLYYLVEDGANNRLVCTASGSDASGSFRVYQTKKYQFWVIKFYYDPADFALSGAGSNKWVVVKENGLKYIYGDNNSGRNTIQYTVRWNNWIGNSSNTTGQSQMATTWNLSEVSNTWGEKTTYEYSNIDQYVGSASGQKQTEASYLKQIVDPAGRKVQFFYNNKSAQFYMEPHTEQPEPDAYQEIYEKQYMDHIDVLQETGTRYLSVYLRYTSINDPSSNNTAKMLLSYIEERNSLNETQPGMRFDYFTTTGSTGYKGQLQKITYPTGGTVSYTYAMTNNTIGHSNRSLLHVGPPTAWSAPYATGYSEPNVWFGSDYVVVAWRALGQGLRNPVNAPPGSTQVSYNHVTDQMPVVLSVYQWVGEWKRQDLTMIPGVTSDFPSSTDSNGNVTYLGASHYTNFQVVTQDNFFGILNLTKQPTATTHTLYLFYKDETIRGNWKAYTPYASDLGDDSPTLLSGDKFVAIGAYGNNPNQQGQVFNFIGNNFVPVNSSGLTPIIWPTQNDNFYTAANNYFIDCSDPWIFKLFYLTELGSWNTSTIPQSIAYSGTNGSLYSPSSWYGTNSFAVAMAGQNPEFIYRWDINYTNFVRDNGAGSMLNYWDDNSYVFTIDNSMVGLVDYTTRGRAVRFDGNTWSLSTQWTTGSKLPSAAGFGPDLFICADASNTHRRTSTFDPNALSWLDATMTIGSTQPMMGRNMYVDNATAYFRMPNGTWNQMGATNFVGTPVSDFLVNQTVTYYVKNGNYSIGIADQIGSTNAVYSDYDQFNVWTTQRLFGPSSIINYEVPSNIFMPLFRDANGLNLYYGVQGHFLGSQQDYPVNSITIHGTDTPDETVAFDYNFATASTDPSGNVAQYAEVNVIPGSTSASSKPQGYTKTYFNNGLSQSDDPNIAYVGTVDLRWMGQRYKEVVYDNTGAIVSTTTFTYGIYGVQLAGVGWAYYVRPTSSSITQDGVTTTTTNTYDSNSGGSVRSTTISSGMNSYTMEYLYGWEVYFFNYKGADLVNPNLLTPLAKVSKKVNGIYTESKVTRWKTWTSATGITAPAIYDELMWNGTNSTNFTSWDATNYPSSGLTDWTLIKQITKRDDYTGTPVETMTKGNITSSILLDQYKMRPIANVSNAGYNQIAYTGFEDSDQGNWSWIPATVGTINSNSIFAKTGGNYLQIGSTGISNKNSLSSTETYILSFWAKSTNGGTLSLNGTSQPPIASTWTYYESTITGQTSIAIALASGSVAIDELRLYPKRAVMTTTSYDLVYGPISQTDRNNRSVFLRYDAWGRLTIVLDDDGNFVQTNNYNTKK